MYKKIYFIFILIILFLYNGFGNEILLQQNDVDLKDFIMSMGKILKLNFVLPPNISGKVNVVSFEKIKSENLFPIFETILNQNNYTLKKSDDFYEIAQISDATKETNFYNIYELRKIEEGYITTIIEFKYLNPSKIPQVMNVLQSLSSKFGTMKNYENYLIITDIKSNILKMKDAADLLDIKDNDIVTKIIKLRNSSVININQRLSSILNGMKSIGKRDYKYSIIPYEANNSIILVSTEDDIKVIEQIVTKLDEDYELNNIFKVFQLNYSSTSDIIKQLRELISSGSLAGDEKDIVTKTKIFEDERRNAIIVATGTPKIIDVIDDYLKTADTEVIKPNDLLKVFDLKFINKEDMANLLNELLKSVTASLKNEAQSTSISAIPGRSAILVSTPSYIIMDRIKNIVQELDIKVDETKGGMQIYRLKNAQAKNIAETLNKLDFTELDPAKKEKINLKVVPDIETNSLIMTGQEKYFNNLVRIIECLDIERKQVLIDALIAEVSVDIAQNIGVEWLATTNKYHNYYIYGTSNQNMVDKSALQNQGPKAAAMALSGFSVGILKGDGDDIASIINLNRKNANFNVLSTPQILTLDNKEAFINVGKEVPFLTNSRITDNNNTIRSFEYKNVGINLKITPHISESGNITLEIRQEVKNLGEEVIFDAPTINTREISTEVSIKDGQTIIIGGLIKNDKTESVQKVPVLGDIPLLGFLFKRNVISNSKTNLLVFINPKVIKSAVEIENYTNTKREEYKKDEKELDKEK